MNILFDQRKRHSLSLSTEDISSDASISSVGDEDSLLIEKTPELLDSPSSNLQKNDRVIQNQHLGLDELLDMTTWPTRADFDDALCRFTPSSGMECLKFMQR